MKQESNVENVLAGVEGDKQLQSEDDVSEPDPSVLVDHTSANLLNQSLPFVKKEPEPDVLGKR